MRFERFVDIVEIVVLVTAVAFVVALFANEPGDGATAPAAVPGAATYQTSCATCHGQDGQGGVGPTLAGAVAGRFPDPADQIAVVRDGRRGMPSFDGRLTDEEIAQVVEYTRTELGT